MTRSRSNLPRVTRMSCAMSRNGARGCIGTGRVGNSRTRSKPLTWRAPSPANSQTPATTLTSKPKIASAKTVAAIERLARADRRHAATVEQWDADPWVLNTPSGIVDLRTGSTLLHDPERYITKIVAVAPGGECPLWLKFLAEVTGGNNELQGFLQRIAGYALTGSIREHALFFFYGTGGNGKGVFLNTLTEILADYGAVAPMETFIVTQGERHPTDLAGLARRAARHRAGNRAWPALGREQDQGANGRRSDHSPVHAAGLLHLLASFQARHRRQSQT